MRDTTEKLKREEEELEKLAFGTPESKETTEDTAPTQEVETEDTPAKPQELVAPKAEPVTDEQPIVKTEDWEKRYKNLRSKRDQSLIETKGQLSAALSTISTLQSQLTKLTAEAPKVDPLAGVFTEEDTENLGEATVDALRKVTQKATEAATKPLQEQLKVEQDLRMKQQEELKKKTDREAYDLFLSRISSAVPNWETLNYDKKFLQYLESSDVDGIPRKVYFKKAEADRNAAMVIRYMKDYEGAQSVTKSPLESKITPTGDAAGATQLNLEKQPKMISKAYIDKFYDDVTRGKYKGRYSEAQKIEKEIEKATLERRIVP